MSKEIVTVDGTDFVIIKEFECVHSFTKNIYARSGTMPKGTIVVGHIHKEPHLNILSSGSMKLWMDGVVVDVVAPAIFEAPANSRKILFTNEDCVFTNIHNSNKKNLQELEDELIDKTEITIDMKEIVRLLLQQKELICG